MSLPPFPTDMQPVLTACAERNIFCPTLFKVPAAQLYDLDVWIGNLYAIRDAFAPHFMHAIAIKSNSISALLRMGLADGFAGEAASIGEAIHLESLGFTGSNCVFDSPIKTAPEIAYALKHRFYMNMDSIGEIDTCATAVQELYEAETATAGQTAKADANDDAEWLATLSPIGIRMNPLVGAGTIAALSVSTKDSKFGTPSSELPSIISKYRQYKWLTSMHCHVGSGGMGTQILARGIRTAVDAALAVNEAVGSRQIKNMDIGGGLPCNYFSDEWEHEEKNIPTVFEYAAHLRTAVPELFDHTFDRVTTEFGQSSNAKAAQLVSVVQQVKQPGPDSQIAVLHFGADACVRQVYGGVDHQRRLEVYANEAAGFARKREAGDGSTLAFAGPLCFQGDFTLKDAPGVVGGVVEGDVCVMKDAGSTTLSAWSRHCSRLLLPVWGYRWNADRTAVTEMVELHSGEPMESVCHFWGGKHAKFEKVWER